MAKMKRPDALAGANGAVENSDTNKVVPIISALRSQALRTAKAAWLAGERGKKPARFRLPPGAFCCLVIGRDDVLPRYRVIACKPWSEGEQPPNGALFFQCEAGADWSDISERDAADAYAAIEQGQYAGFAFNSIGEALRCQRVIGGRAE